MMKSNSMDGQDEVYWIFSVLDRRDVYEK